jgi:hypothetical protein
MGRAYDWARLGGLRDADEGDRRPSLRTRRGDPFTRWDWVVWWRRRGRVDVVRCSSGVAATPGACDTSAVAVQHAQNARGARFQPAARS